MSDRHELRVYGPGSPLRAPVRFLREQVARLRASRELAWLLLVRNIQAQYRQTLLGYVWAFVPPVVMAVTWTLLNRSHLLSIAATPVPYPIFALTGTVLWQGFVDALQSPLKQLSESSSLVRRVRFPHEALVLAGLGEVALNSAIRLTLIAPALLLFGQPVPVTFLAGVAGVLALIGLGAALGTLLLPLGLLYQDVPRAVGAIVPLWFFLTPVVYPVAAAGPARLLAIVNPVSPLLDSTRELLTLGAISRPGGFLSWLTATLLLVVVSWLFYGLAMPNLIARVPGR